jgi:hypothetical protein
MRFPIDTTAMGFLCASAPEEVVDFDTKRPKVDEHGTPLFQVQLVAMAEGTAEVLAVKVAGAPNGITVGVACRPVGLAALPWSMNGRNGVAYRAERLEPLANPNPGPAGPARTEGRAQQ